MGPESVVDSAPITGTRNLALFKSSDYHTLFTPTEIKAAIPSTETDLGRTMELTNDNRVPTNNLSANLPIDLNRHRGSELWWMFQWIDSNVEQIINEIDRDLGVGHGRKVSCWLFVPCYLFICLSFVGGQVMKTVLVSFPVVIFVVVLAFWLIQSSG